MIMCGGTIRAVPTPRLWLTRQPSHLRLHFLSAPGRALHHAAASYPSLPPGGCHSSHPPNPRHTPLHLLHLPASLIAPPACVTSELPPSKSVRAESPLTNSVQRRIISDNIPAMNSIRGNRRTRFRATNHPQGLPRDEIHSEDLPRTVPPSDPPATTSTRPSLCAGPSAADRLRGVTCDEFHSGDLSRLIPRKSIAAPDWMPTKATMWVFCLFPPVLAFCPRYTPPPSHLPPLPSFLPLPPLLFGLANRLRGIPRSRFHSGNLLRKIPHSEPLASKSLRGTLRG
ncbi:hypothetical protein B0H19DRAFT_1369204 [Mycena capillaripes]|nr:hypothetical protein B0H19DRAFT_1369204 [Mycena capillaripes]